MSCHGPLQRLLEDAINQPTVRARKWRCNEAKARRWIQPGLRRLPARAHRMRRTKGLPLQLPVLHDSQDESRLRTLTVKLRGRAPTPAMRRGRTLSPGARGANQSTPHGPLQRLLEAARGCILKAYRAGRAGDRRDLLSLRYPFDCPCVPARKFSDLVRRGRAMRITGDGKSLSA